MIYCKRCGNKLFEDETYIEEGVAKVEITCLVCPNKIYVEKAKWEGIKKRIERAIIKSKKEKALSTPKRSAD